MRRGEWSLLLLRLLSVGERMKGHSDMIKPVLFLSQFHVYKFWSRLSKKNGSFFLKKLQSWICLWRTRLRVNRTCRNKRWNEHTLNAEMSFEIKIQNMMALFNDYHKNPSNRHANPLWTYKKLNWSKDWDRSAKHASRSCVGRPFVFYVLDRRVSHVAGVVVKFWIIWVVALLGFGVSARHLG